MMRLASASQAAGGRPRPPQGTIEPSGPLTPKAPQLAAPQCPPMSQRRVLRSPCRPQKASVELDIRSSGIDESVLAISEPRSKIAKRSQLRPALHDHIQTVRGQPSQCPQNRRSGDRRMSQVDAAIRVNGSFAASPAMLEFVHARTNCSIRDVSTLRPALLRRAR
jgi:hypothetical protein